MEVKKKKSFEFRGEGSIRHRPYRCVRLKSRQLVRTVKIRESTLFSLVSHPRRGSAYLTVQLFPPSPTLSRICRSEVKSFVGALTGPPLRPSLSGIRQSYFNGNPSGARLQNANCPLLVPHTHARTHLLHIVAAIFRPWEGKTLESAFSVETFASRSNLSRSLSLSRSAHTHAGSPCNYYTRNVSRLRVRLPRVWKP